MGFRQGRQQNGPQRHAEHTSRQLHQAVGVIHPGHGACDQKGGKDRIDDQRNLADRHPEDRRPHLLHHAPHACVPEVQTRQHQHADLVQMRQLEQQLRQAPHQHRPAQRHDRRIEIGGQKQGKHDHADVE